MVSKVTIPESLFEALLLHAFSDEGNEIMGLLIGELKTNDNEADDDEENGKSPSCLICKPTDWTNSL